MPRTYANPPILNSLAKSFRKLMIPDRTIRPHGSELHHHPTYAGIQRY